MRKNFKRLGISLLLLAGFLGCAKTNYINKFYSKPLGSAKLAIVPVFHQYGEASDNIFEEKFSSASGVDELVAPEAIREKMLEDEKNAKVAADQKLKRILTKVRDKIYSSRELKDNLGISGLLSQTELGYLKERMDDASMILFPVVFNIVSAGNSATGYIKVRVYDLNTGEFIYENAMEIREIFKETGATEEGGHAIRQVISKLLELVKQDFEKTLVSG